MVAERSSFPSQVQVARVAMLVRPLQHTNLVDDGMLEGDFPMSFFVTTPVMGASH